MSFTVKNAAGTVIGTYTLANDFERSGETNTYVLKGTVTSLKDLPIGTYTVTETAADPDGYSHSATYTVTSTDSGVSDLPSNVNYTDAGNITAGVTDGKTTTVAVTNTYERKKGDLELTKTVAGATLTEAKTYYFTVSQTTGTGDEAVTTYFGRGSDGKATAGTTTVQYIELEVPANAKTATVTIKDLDNKHIHGENRNKPEPERSETPGQRRKCETVHFHAEEHDDRGSGRECNAAERSDCKRNGWHVQHGRHPVCERRDIHPGTDGSGRHGSDN